jgi:bifunctional enzyme CysN/CysC
VDARKGLLTQSRRHAYIAGLLGIERLVVAVNKMDLVGYDQSVFEQIETDFLRVLQSFPHIQAYFVPVSALAGDNIVTRSANMRWFEGESLLEHLETVEVGTRAQDAPFRFPVQRVVRPNLDFRGYAGTVVSGRVRVGDQVTILPSGRQTAVARIVTFDGDMESADTGAAVTLTLAEEIDLSRGDMIVTSEHPADKAHILETTLVWLNEKPAQMGKRYRFKQASRMDWATLKQVRYRLNINTLDHEHEQTLEMNAIGNVVVETARFTAFDSYITNRATGSFILIDPATNATVAAGMILKSAAFDSSRRLTEVSCRVENGVLQIATDHGLDLKLDAQGIKVVDPEALDALRHFLERLRIQPFDTDKTDWEI